MGLFDDTPKPALNWAVDPKLADASKPAPIWKDEPNATNAEKKQSPRFEIETDLPPPQPKTAKTTDIETREAIPPELRKWPVPTADFKPGIDMVIAVFRNYIRVTSPAEMRRSLGAAHVCHDKYEALAVRHKEQLAEELRGLGFSDLIDFD